MELALLMRRSIGYSGCSGTAHHTWQLMATVICDVVAAKRYN